MTGSSRIGLAIATMLAGLGAGSLTCCPNEPTHEPADVIAPVPVPEPGACRNLDVEGTCTFLVLVPVDAPPRPELPNSILVRVQHTLDANDESFTLASAFLRIPASKEKDLQAYYATHSPTQCSAHIIFPPCNDSGTTVELGAKPPDYATPGRY